MRTARVLIVDANPRLAGELRSQIMQLGMKPLWAAGGREAIELLVRDGADAVVLHDALLDGSGWEAAEFIRAISHSAIIFLCDRLDRFARNRALQLGDEYLTPPWQWERLRARLPGLVRRASAGGPALPDPYDDGFLRVEIARRVAYRAGRPVDLTETEFKLLSCFVRHPDLTLTYNDILQSVWGHRYLKAKSQVSQYVRCLRMKIEANPKRPTYLRTVRGVGYLFAPHPSALGWRGAPISYPR